ncbi:hypothetical protein Dsin_000713 [Dipteronia sinensis]|uniref:Uncharacterized protein n=1 Tax=Dipteronia sinensis TaxID=43782 RepID=A0AAE0EIA8_9ROSI|nr:hypothetical protein Dsin_000713 [Dipteronia sinensis]
MVSIISLYFDEVWQMDTGQRNCMSLVLLKIQRNCMSLVLLKIQDCGRKLEVWNSKQREGLRRDIKSKRLALSEANIVGSVLSWKQKSVIEEKFDSALEVLEATCENRLASKRGQKFTFLSF